jgi:CubicO group peptidase (beta-lactamase class C family)
MRSVLLAFLLSPALAACLLDGNLKHDNPTVPESLADGWEIASPESAGVSPAALASVHHELLREDRHVGTLGFLVVKDGKLVWETYLRSPADRDHYHHVQSVTKSVTSLLLGIVRGDLGGPPLDARLGDLLPDEMAGLEPDKPEIRLRDLLTMRSGIAFDNDRFSREMWVGRPSATSCPNPSTPDRANASTTATPTHKSSVTCCGS